MPFADYGGFGPDYFEAQGLEPAEKSPAYHQYYAEELLDYDQYADHLDQAVGSRKALVVGCGYGFAVKYLVDRGWDRAYGMDISEYAREYAIPDIADRIYLGDARNPADYDRIARGTNGPPRWDGLYSEFLLEHFTDAEAQQVCDYMQQNASIVVHRIWSGTGDPAEAEWFNTKTVAEWQALVGTHANVEWIDHDRPEDSTI